MEKSQASTWRSWFEGEKVSEDFINERQQDVLSVEYLEEFERDVSLTDQKEGFKGDESRRRK